MTLSPPAHVVGVAVEVGARSPCAKSKRGVVLYDTRTGRVVRAAFNSQPLPFACDGSAWCRSHCAKLCQHAEVAALMVLAPGWDSYKIWRGLDGPDEFFTTLDMVHAKVVDGALVESGGPSCWQCSREILASRMIAGVWLYHADGWRRYAAEEFHRLTLEACGLVPP